MFFTKIKIKMSLVMSLV